MRDVEAMMKLCVMRACLAAVVVVPGAVAAQGAVSAPRVVKHTETLPPPPGTVVPGAKPTATARRAPPAVKPSAATKAPDQKPTSVTAPLAPKVTTPTKTQTVPRKPVKP